MGGHLTNNQVFGFDYLFLFPRQEKKYIWQVYIYTVTLPHHVVASQVALCDLPAKFFVHEGILQSFFFSLLFIFQFLDVLM